MSRRPFPGSSPARRSNKGGATSLALTLAAAAFAFAFVRHAVSPAPASVPVERSTPSRERAHGSSDAAAGAFVGDANAFVRERLREKIAAYEAARERERRARAHVDGGDDGSAVVDGGANSASSTAAREEPIASGSSSEARAIAGDVASWDGYDAEDWRRVRDAEASDDECHVLERSDYWGPTPIARMDDGVVKSPQDCCEACKKTDGCHFWRHDPERPGDCFTGKLMNVYLPPMYGATHNKKTTSGTLYPTIPKYDAESTELKTCLHTMITSNGAPYMNWQTRVFYQTWKKAASEPDSVLRKFTRILHRTKDDDLVELIPTWRADPSHPECDGFCDYAVKDRARAIAQWMKTDDSKQCSHILMAETDYLFIRSPPPSVMLAKGYSYGFLFGYINPSYPDAKPASLILHDETRDGPLKDVYQTGNAPQSIHRDDLERVAQVWADKVELGETSEVIKKVFGWVRDMYAWSFAAAAVRPKLLFELPPVPFQKLVIQPPADIAIGQASIMHYTWGSIVSNSTTTRIWAFDKREYRGTWDSLRKIPPPPPWDAEQEFKLQDGQKLQESQYAVLTKMIAIFNEAVDAVIAEDAANGQTGTRHWTESS